MLKKTILIWFLPVYLFGQHPTKFTIGAEHLSSFNDTWNYKGTHADAFWDTVSSFGLNFGSLYFNQYPDVNVLNIKEDLRKANNHGIKIFLWNLFNFNQLPRRWLYQVEGKFDFNYINGDTLQKPDKDADSHWTKKLNISQPNFLRLKKGGVNTGLVVKDLNSKITWPDNLSYSIKIKMRLPNATTFPHLYVISVTLRNELDSSLFETSNITADSFINNKWKELTLFRFFKAWDQPKSAIATKRGNGVIPYDIEIFWPGNIDCDIDYVAVDDSLSDKIFNGSLNSRMDDLAFIFKNDSVANYKIWDEPWPENLPAVRYLNSYLQNKLTENMVGERKPMAFHWFYYSPEKFLSETRLKSLFSDIYPIGKQVPRNTEPDYLTAFQLLMDNDYTSKLSADIQSANHFNVPFISVIQTHSWSTKDEKGYWNWELREPNAYEIKLMVNLSVCYGAKGIYYYLFTNPSEGIFKGTGMLKSNNHTNPLPYIIDSAGYNRWEILKNLNHKLSKIGDDLMKLKWERAFSINKEELPVQNYISKVESYINFPSNKDNKTNTYIQLGEFKNESDNFDYFYIVNRRTIPTEKRIIVVNMNKSIAGQNKWEIQEIGTDIKWIIPGNGNFQSTFDPAEGKLFRLTKLSQ
jgi:hypothetical protein